MDEIYRTTGKQKVRLYEIADSMRRYGLDTQFIANAVKVAEIYEGAFDLFCLWEEESDENEKNNIVSVLQKEIEEFEDFREDSVKKPMI